MVFGFNTDVMGADHSYHVQTEDGGSKNPVIDSIICVGGKIVDRVRTAYIPQNVSAADIEAMVREQHREVVESIRSGVFAPTLQSPATTVAPRGYTIELLNHADIVREGQLRLEFAVWNREQAGPARDALLDIRWMPAGCDSQKVQLRTEEGGKAVAWFPIPEGPGEIMLLVCAQGDQGREVVKFTLHGHVLTEDSPPDRPAA